LNALSRELKKRVHLYFIGSGELKEEMEDRADNILRKYGIKTFFSGFVNQSELAPHYLALDILVLPSRRMGETWGLVANEGMQAGCAVVVSNAVGSYADFSGWERFRVFKENDENDLANKIEELANFKRDFDWASEKLKQYSIEAVVTAFLTELKK
jgi:glycosyltransferase involved in cell wall biosynthesis